MGIVRKAISGERRGSRWPLAKVLQQNQNCYHTRCSLVICDFERKDSENILLLNGCRSGLRYGVPGLQQNSFARCWLATSQMGRVVWRVAIPSSRDARAVSSLARPALSQHHNHFLSAWLKDQDSATLQKSTTSLQKPHH